MSAPPSPSRLLTPAEVSELLQVPMATLYRWSSKKEGPRTMRVGRHLRYRASDLDKWLESLERADEHR